MKLEPKGPSRPYRRSMSLVLVLALSGCVVAGCGGGGGQPPPQGEPPVVATVQPGQGISVEQVDFDFPGGRDPNSTWGRLVLDPGVLSQVGLRGGYVTVVTAKGRAVANVPVPGVEEPPHSIFFDLGLAQSTELSETLIDVMHSNVALRDVRAYTKLRVAFSVKKWVFQAHGIGPDSELEKLVPPDDAPRVYALEDLPSFLDLLYSNYQAITNIQCAVNQCFPMATANGLQFLEDTGAIMLPHDHSQGIGVVSDPTHNTLVGQLDIYANRSVTSRTSGVGVWFEPMIDGTFEYLQDNSLDGVLTFRHQDVGYGETIPVGDYTAFGSTSLNDGATVSWDWIDDRLTDGCAVSMIYVAHAVRITGAGRVGGQYWIRYSHDSVQSNDTTGLENVITYLTDPDSDGLLNMDGSQNREIRWVWAACP